MTEQIKAPGKIQLIDEEITNLSGAQFKTLVIRVLIEMVEYGHKIEGKVKAMQSKICLLYTSDAADDANVV